MDFYFIFSYYGTFRITQECEENTIATEYLKV